MLPCPECRGDTKVFDTVTNFEDREIYRRRRRLACGFVFHTIEKDIKESEELKKRWDANHRKTKNKLIYQKSPIQQ